MRGLPGFCIRLELVVIKPSGEKNDLPEFLYFQISSLQLHFRTICIHYILYSTNVLGELGGPPVLNSVLCPVLGLDSSSGELSALWS